MVDYIYIYMWLHIYVRAYTSVCMCVCVWVCELFRDMPLIYWYHYKTRFELLSATQSPTDTRPPLISAVGHTPTRVLQRCKQENFSRLDLRYRYCLVCFLSYITCIIKNIRGACGVMVIVVGNGHGDSSSNPGLIPHRTNTLGKGMNPIVLPPAMGK